MVKPKFLLVSTVSLTLYFFKGQVRFLNQYFDVEVVASPDEKLESFAKTEGVIYHGLPMRREISLFQDIMSLLKMIRLVHKTKPEIIHGNTPKAGLISMMAGWLMRIPGRIYYVHGLRYEGASGLKKRFLMLMESLSCHFATEIFSVSYGIKEKLASDKITSKEVSVISNGSINGIDPNFFNPALFSKKNIREKYNIPSTAVVLGYVGRLVGDKGINELIEAFLGLKQERERLYLLLVGNFEDHLDPLKSSTKETIETHPNIKAVGFQSDIRPFLSAMDLFVFPSYREGFGVSLMEAGAMGLPIISTNITGCNEIIQQGSNGFLVPSKSSLELISKVSGILNGTQNVSWDAHQIRNHIITKYDQNRIWNEAYQYYSKVLGN
ncbi:glycosyltransferase family 4 protein [Muriicola marianensis]|uniref:Glycosyl transferase family 1 n=1 Tax=Muriicola marianensis TaxID=1324801 RepID=A0ABQ1QQJ1_9FLAO|nr:glycosyltransferase family 4 protein [Muriicola marianensis]GGD41025.1 glycosyl transferase family 1 [Muriicola marianensis]